VFNQLIAAATEAIDAAQSAQTSAQAAQRAAKASEEQAAQAATTATSAADAAGNAAANAATSANSASELAAKAQASETAAAASAQAASTAAATSAQAASTAAAQIAAYRYDPNTYEGVDLAEKFAEEIANYSDTWAWIRARIQAGNYTDIHVGDYIPFVTTNSVSLKAQIAGIDTYTGYGDTAVGHHVDFICEELWPTTRGFNKVNFNNGISSDVPYPWLASDLYHFVNSLSGTVPSSAVVGGGDGAAVNYTANGIYYYLPNALKAVIIQKRMMLPKRYSGSGVLSSDNGSGWANAGYLWLPTEWEVYGAPVWGNAGYGAVGTAVQYPLFAHGMRRMKKRNGSPSYWWLLSAYAGYSTLFASVSRYGTADANSTSYAGNTVPVCFRVG
jgi:hypothetical protein